ncbi:cystatin-B-like [Rhinichthys klamathensis goyatoka]|uniref:cystatin-B-like n=1 Tax=Rhinichthys klamathensis goyatoka TaxID=3034132 RepID=UPI0024B49B0B|nr:cystatin-B-like [Rhinichthys klamathensis goyatoka]XP_056096523.1 cystatin-B-like [Rhinichthys klamathensis goyatoka]XP_056096525.1 cystatin-B-like [Rhinichthys klamathensis goyatoka]
MTAEIAEGWSTEAFATDEVENMCIKMKADIEKKTGVHFDVFIPKTFRSEPKCGGHYLVKVKVGIDEYVHMVVCVVNEDIDKCLTVKGVQYPKSKSHPLEPFGKLPTACGK